MFYVQFVHWALSMRLPTSLYGPALTALFPKATIDAVGWPSSAVAGLTTPPANLWVLSIKGLAIEAEQEARRLLTTYEICQGETLSMSLERMAAVFQFLEAVKVITWPELRTANGRCNPWLLAGRNAILYMTTLKPALDACQSLPAALMALQELARSPACGAHGGTAQLHGAGMRPAGTSWVPAAGRQASWGVPTAAAAALPRYTTRPPQRKCTASPTNPRAGAHGEALGRSPLPWMPPSWPRPRILPTSHRRDLQGGHGHPSAIGSHAWR